jgi:hypothetical protein
MFLESFCQALRMVTKRRPEIQSLVIENTIGWRLKKKVSITKILVIKKLCSPYEWQPKMGFNHCLKKFHRWMAIEIFWLLATEFGKGAWDMFLESSHQTLHVVTKGDQKFNH